MIQKILLFGTIPPPVGGVSMHIERFLQFSGNDSKIDLAVCDIKKISIYTCLSIDRGWKEIYKAFIKSHIIHLHLSNNSIKIILAILAKIFFKKVIYTHHNSRIGSSLGFKFINFLSNIVILVNDKEINLTNLNKNKIRVIPAFLPPYSFKELPHNINENIKKRNFVISTNCFRYTEFEKKDLYGFDLIMDAYAQLLDEKKLKDTILIVVDPSGTTIKYFKYLLEKYTVLNTSNILHVTKPIDFSNLIKQSNLTLRATRSDGDSLSIRESLYFNVSVIASDVTQRPKGTELFENENVIDLKNKILNIYNGKISPPINNTENFADNIITVYKELV